MSEVIFHYNFVKKWLSAIDGEDGSTSWYGMVPSMSRIGDCWDNSPTERFFRSLKSERLSDYAFTTRKSAIMEVLDYIAYYNGIRLHSTLGYQSPMAYEKEHYKKAA